MFKYILVKATVIKDPNNNKLLSIVHLKSVNLKFFHNYLDIY